jgi:hypothetical protein
MLDYIDQLLDAAKDVTGSDYKTAKALEVSSQRISDWRKKRSPMPVADVVLLADLAGLRPGDWAARAIVEKFEGTAKGDKLYRALGKASLAIGAAVASSGANALQIFSHKGAETIAEAVSYFIRCIESLSFKHFNYR